MDSHSDDALVEDFKRRLESGGASIVNKETKHVRRQHDDEYAKQQNVLTERLFVTS